MRLARAIAAAALAVGLLASCSSGAKTETNASGDSEVVQAGDLDAFALKPGNCLVTTTLDSDEVTSVPAVPCTEPHDAEVTLLVDTDVKMYDEDEISADAQSKCEAALSDYLGVPWSQTVLESNYLSPTSQSWTSGDREIACMAIDISGSNLKESVKGKGADYPMPGGETKKNYSDLAAGDCMISDDQAKSDMYYLTVDCATPHDMEIMGAVQSAADASTFDEDAVDADAEQQCQAMFESYVGSDYGTSALDFNYMTPTSWAWLQGDREVMCLAQAAQPDLTASVAGTGQ